MSDWVSPCDRVTGGKTCTSSSMLVKIMNNDKFNAIFHPWSDDHYVTCQLDAKADMQVEPGDVVIMTKKMPSSFAAVTNSQIQQEYEGITHEHEGFKIQSAGTPSASASNRPCKIVGVDRSKETFDVVIFLDPRSAKQRATVAGIEDLVGLLYREREFAASKVKFVGKVSTSDTHYVHGFRHEIAIPDESFPELWKDLKETSSIVYSLIMSNN